MDSKQICKLSGCGSMYKFKVIEELPDADLEKYIARARRKFAKIAKSFDDQKNTEWLTRNYLALKYILAATVIGTSAEYARDHNIRITLPYSNYYMMLLCCRSLILSCPFSKWRGYESIGMEQQKIINIATEEISTLNKELGVSVKSDLEAAKNWRELFSYRFPAGGFSTSNTLERFESAVRISRLLTDLAQLNSACLQGSVDKHGKPPYAFDFSQIYEYTVIYDAGSESQCDDEDEMRIRYFIRKTDRPYSILSLATDGLTEDFFSAWVDYDETREGKGYNPDSNCTMLLSMH